MMQEYYILEPEVAGGLGSRTIIDSTVHPPIVSKLHYQLEGWLGDELLESFPCYVVTESLARRISECRMTGVEFADVEISYGREFGELRPFKEMPKFLWLKPRGVAGKDDFGIGPNLKLVVSSRALESIRATGPTALDVAPYVENEPRES